MKNMAKDNVDSASASKKSNSNPKNGDYLPF